MALGLRALLRGGLTAAAGLLSLIRPLRWLGIRTRGRGALVVAAGAVLALGAMLLPDTTRTTDARDTLIDRWLPEWQFGESHERRVRASPRQVFAAIRSRSILGHLPLPHAHLHPESEPEGPGRARLNPPAEKPILDVALAGGFVLLGEDADKELLLGTVVIAPPDIVRAARQGKTPSLDPELFQTLGRPGFARAVMNFRAIPESDGWTRVTTETRVHALDRETQRRFARYWRVMLSGKLDHPMELAARG